MKLSIYSLKKILFQGEAKSLNCKTVVGEVTVLDWHKPLVSVLVKGVAKVEDTDKKEFYFPISAGFLEVKAGNEARLLVEE